MRIYLFLLATLLATSVHIQKALAESGGITPKNACLSALFAKGGSKGDSKRDSRSASVAGQMPGCRSKKNVSPPSPVSPFEAFKTMPPVIEGQPRLFVFVSFSMPDLSLKNLAQEAQTHKAVLVMRGLYEDSFARTAQKLQQLGISVDINPELFETHAITAVPTFALVRQGHPVQILKGNVTLTFAAKKFEGQHIETEPIKEVP